MSDLCIQILKCREDAVLPKYAHDGDAGMDLYAAEEVVVAPGKSALVPIGIKLAIPYGYEVQIRPRSGISLKTLIRLPNAPGTIDCGYRDELNVLVFNASFPSADSSIVNTLDVKDCPQGSYLIRKGDRIAQMVVSRVQYASFDLVTELSDEVDNRGGGFGSSGIK